MVVDKDALILSAVEIVAGSAGLEAFKRVFGMLAAAEHSGYARGIQDGAVIRNTAEKHVQVEPITIGGPGKKPH